MEMPHTQQEPAGFRLRWYTMVLLFWCMLSFMHRGSAQLPVHVHYTINDGLPSNKIYQMQQAPDGYIWIATNKGVARFDGNRFRNFSVSDGLPTNDVFSTYSDASGKTWLMDFKDGLHYLENDSLHTVYTAGHITKEEKISPLNDGTDRTYIVGFGAEQFGWYWYVDRDTLKQNTFYNAVAQKYKKEEIMYCDFRQAMIFSSGYAYLVQGKRTRKIKLTRHILHKLQYETAGLTRRHNLIHGDRVICQISVNSLLMLDLRDFHIEELVIDALNTSRIISFVKNGPALQILTNTGLFQLDTSLHIIDSADLRAYFANDDICTAIKDNAGNIWMGSRNNGIYLLPFFTEISKRYKNLR